MLGALIKARFGLPFVSHFSDLYVDHPHKAFSVLDRWKERFIIKQSDRAIFTNEAAKELVMRKYPLPWRERARVIPHCFDPHGYPKDVVTPAGLFIVRHIGAFYGNGKRNPEFLFHAFMRLFRERPDLRPRCRIELVGAINEYTEYNYGQLEAAVARYELADVVDVVPPVSYPESLALMKSAHCLVVIDADAVESPFLPSKVVDYAGSGTMIVGITPRNSPTAAFLENAGYRSFDYRDLSGLTSFLREMATGTVRERRNEAFISQFDVRNTAAAFVKEFSSLVQP